MLKQIGYALRGSCSAVLYVLNTLVWATPIFILSFFKLIPVTRWRTAISGVLDRCATAWIGGNTLNQRLFSRIKWDVQGIEGLTRQDWYLVIANHQSWVDILVLQRHFNRKIPFLKFFLKRELIWVPVLGLAWWALDFPFMRRYSKAYLTKHPHLKGKDLETTRKACEKFRNKPVSIMNFVEGTRITQLKHKLQDSPFQHLLKPRAGGMAFVLSVMGSQLHKLLDVTINYPQGIPSFWDFICGKVKHVQVRVNVHPIDELLRNNVFSMDYFDNPEQRARFQAWLNELWQQKDATMTSLAATR
ncbi:acyltransferase [Aestuariibacter halophilus]|uniref:Acyltransferase n=1 Tax=Fluctibacter halophilus TaxID=226011 RepID=A0ABS8GBI7_9ALTE|nr:acyltransferase [Aestuariibacter halophilus]MCC2617858.1 acyltransferase [Aestuariibacter halophilus]